MLSGCPWERGLRMPLLGPHQEFHPLYFQFSPEFQACSTSSLLLWRGWRRSCLLRGFWWDLRDFFLLPILSTAGQDTERVRRCLGKACIHSFKAKCGAPPLPGPGLDGAADIVVRPISSWGMGPMGYRPITRQGQPRVVRAGMGEAQRLMGRRGS